MDFFFDDENAELAAREALVWRNQTYRYSDLFSAMDSSENYLAGLGVTSGQVVSLEADFSPSSLGYLFALLRLNCVVVPLTGLNEEASSSQRMIAEVEWRVQIEDGLNPRVTSTGVKSSHELIQSLRKQGRPGIVLFSSGTSGKKKAVLHDALKLTNKYKTKRLTRRTVAFLLFDHISGLDTLFYTFSNGGCLIVPPSRTPDEVCRAIEMHRAEVLPVSPTFLNLILLSEVHQKYDLSSLEIITYGAEVMPQTTLTKIHQIFPKVKLQQKYGMTEIGALRSKSRTSDSLWVKLGGEGYQCRVANGLLEIKAESALVGYLNAPSPFTDDGWVRTQDQVEVDGEYIRILGRASEMINVGGQKVTPSEVEDVLLKMEGVSEVVVRSEPHPITGRSLLAEVVLSTQEDKNTFRRRMVEFCKGKLASHQVPFKVILVEGKLHSDRFKKMRSGGG